MIALLACILSACALAGTPAVRVDVNMDIRHSVGGVSELDRSVFFNAHASPYEPDWNGEEDKLAYYVNELNSHMGRNTGGISNTLNMVREDPNRPGYADPEHLSELAGKEHAIYQGQSNRHAFNKATETILAAQLHPFWPDGKHRTLYNKPEGWTLSTTDTPDEPLGTATGEFMARYIDEFFGDGGEPRPRYFEVINEPLYKLTTTGDTDPIDVFRFHNTVTSEIRKRVPDVQIGGYTMAFPYFERDDFERWERRFKLFVDTAGANMDYYSIHLYDFPGINRGRVTLRRGSNNEAVFDMIDHYSEIKLGQRKPYLISEYGSQLHDWYEEPWSPYRDWLCLKAYNAMVMQFMERPDQILKAITFTPVKAEWGRNSDNIPYHWRLMRRANEGDDDLSDDREGPWVWTDQIKFFELWSDVRGTRVDCRSSHLDVQSLAYADGKNLYIILNNLATSDQQVRLLAQVQSQNQLMRVESKKLYLDPTTNAPKLIHQLTDVAADVVTLEPEATVILRYDFDKPISMPHKASETKCFADTYLQPITAGKPITFRIQDVPLAEHGETTLRLGVGRDHGFSPFPQAIQINGHPVPVNESLRGDDKQSDRQRFFGLLEVPVPNLLLDEDNTVTVTFPDTNGHISSVALRVVNFTRPVERP